MIIIHHFVCSLRDRTKISFSHTQHDDKLVKKTIIKNILHVLSEYLFYINEMSDLNIN